MPDRNEQSDPSVAPPVRSTAEAKSRFGRILWTSTGTVFLAIGAVGVVLPLLPTTPFLLLAAFCYARGSRRFHRWLMESRTLGAYLRDYQENRAMAPRAKLVTISFLWAMILVAALLFVDEAWIQFLLVLVAAGVTVHIVTLRSSRRSVRSEEP